MKTSNITKRILAAALLALTASSASAALIFTIEQVGDDVVMATTGGSLNITDLNFYDNESVANNEFSSFRGDWSRINTIDPNVPYDGTVDLYFGFSLDDQLSTSSTEFYADSASGERYWFQDSIISVPTDYVSGVALGAATMTFENTTLAAMSLSDGGYSSWTWGSGATADSIRVQVGAVPEPATAGLLGLSAGAIFFARRAKKYYSL